MTTVAAFDADGFDFNWDLSGVAAAQVLSSSPTSVTLSIPGGPQLVLGGTFTSFDVNGKPTAGSYTSLSVTDGVDTFTTMTGMNVDVGVWNGYVAAPDPIALRAAIMAGNDTFNGSSGRDGMVGLAGDDTLNGAAGDDFLRGGAGIDTLNGGADNDVLWGEAGNDILNGGAGVDVISGGAGADSINGGDGNDVIAGGQIIGNVLNDPGTSIVSFQFLANAAGDPGADVLDGGNGFDLAVLNYTLQPGAMTVDISNPGQVFTILRDGASFGSITNVEALNFTGGLGNDVVTGGALADTLSGGSGDDTLVGGAGADTLNGGSGDDIMVGGAGNDNLGGNTGIDTAVFSGNRSDYSVSAPNAGGQVTVTDLRNGSPDGTDTVTAEYLQFADQTIAALPNTQVGDGANNTLTAVAGGVNFLDGKAGDDTLNGGSANDWMSGGVGNDVINGNAGNDQIEGGAGADQLNGGDGADQIFGGDGDDQIDGGINSPGFTDVLQGEAGNDTIIGDGNLIGGLGDDTLTDRPNGVAALLEGGLGNDLLIGAGAETTVSYATAGSAVTVDLSIGAQQDTLGAGLDTITNAWNLFGSAFDDLLSGDAHANVINGGLGDDHLVGRAGDDVLIGGFGDDFIDGGAGIDTADFSSGGQYGLEVDLTRVGAQDTGNGFDTLVSIENVTGSTFSDSITGDAGANLIQGLIGFDTLDGGGGNDVLIGGGDNDTLHGGAGNDTAVFSGARANYTIVTNAGVTTVTDNRGGSPEGVDTLDGVEHLQFSDQTVHLAGASVTYTGATEGQDFFWDIGGLGGALVISSNMQTVVLDPGGDGETLVTLRGEFTAFDGAGHPTAGTLNRLTVNSGGEISDFDGISIGVAQYNAFVAAGDTLGLQNAIFGGPDSITGTNLNDDLRAFAGDDHVSALDGDDRVLGFDGDDTIDGGIGNDYLYGLNGDDTLIGGEGRDALMGGAGTDNLSGGNGDDFLGGSNVIASLAPTGQFYADWSWGAYPTDASPDVLDGGAGNDLAVFNYALQTGAFTIDISNPAQVFTILRDGAAFGSIVNVEALNVQGGLGDDHFTGGAFNDVLTGNLGNDVLTGGLGNDQLQGDSGDDVMIGGAGNDTLVGGTGVDTAVFSGNLANYLITRNATNGQVIVTDQRGGSPDGTDVLLGVEKLQFADGTVFAQSSSLEGDGNANTLNGAVNVDYIFGGGGNDTLSGGGGSTDFLSGGAGDDTITGGAGNDQIDGGDGNDVLHGGGGSGDIINGGAGNDIIDGVGTLNGEAGDDQITGNGTLFGFTGNDTLTDPVDGLPASLEGGPGDDVLNGNTALIPGASSSETTASYALATGGVTVDLRISGPQFTGASTGADTLNNIWNVSGGGYNDTFYGNDNANVLFGNTGDDHLYGLGGNDVLNGSFSDDYMDGGDGIDTVSYSGVTSEVTVDLRLQGVAQYTGSAGGFDTLVGIENLFGTSLNDTLIGDDNANVLTGGANNANGFNGADVLIGNGGNDILNGGSGNDILDGGAGTDLAIFTGARINYSIVQNGNGTLTVTDLRNGSPDGTDTLAGVELLAFSNTTQSIGQALTNQAPVFAGAATGIAPEAATINGFTSVVGSLAATTDVDSAINFTVAQQGIYGTVAITAAGDWTYTVNNSLAAVDALDSQSAPLTDTVIVQTDGTPKSIVITINGIDDIRQGDANDNVLTGTGGRDTLYGLAGNDTLTGGLGADSLSGGTGNDTFKDTTLGLSGDTITDLTLGDRIQITDANAATFTFAVNGSVMTYSGGAVAITGGIAAGYHLEKSAAPQGVYLTLVQNPVSIINNGLSGDFNGDGKDDLLWRSDAGQMSDWLGQANGGFVGNDANAFANVPTSWKIIGAGDFNGDGKDDILWRSDTGQLSNWLGKANGGFTANDANAYQVVPTDWKVAGVGDFNGDGKSDLLWRSDAGLMSDWLGQANGGFVGNDANAFTSVPTNWHIIGVGDFNGDHRDDILWRSDTGQMSNWLGQANGGFVGNDGNAFVNVPLDWHIVGVGDFNGDGKSDLLWRSDQGYLSDWLGQANGGFVANDANAFTQIPLDWMVAAVGDYNGDGRDDIMWRNTNGAMSNWLGKTNGGFQGNDANAYQVVDPSWHIQVSDLFAI